MKTIASNTEISSLFSSGKRINKKNFSIIYEPVTQHDHIGRVAFIAGKKLGNAVWRNSSKRRLRELYRTSIDSLEGFDVLCIAKKNLLSSSFTSVLQEWNQAVLSIINEKMD